MDTPGDTISSILGPIHRSCHITGPPSSHRLASIRRKASGPLSMEVRVHVCLDEDRYMGSPSSSGNSLTTCRLPMVAAEVRVLDQDFIPTLFTLKMVSRWRYLQILWYESQGHVTHAEWDYGGLCSGWCNDHSRRRELAPDYPPTQVQRRVKFQTNATTLRVHSLFRRSSASIWDDACRFELAHVARVQRSDKIRSPTLILYTYSKKTCLRALIYLLSLLLTANVDWSCVFSNTDLPLRMAALGRW